MISPFFSLLTKKWLKSRQSVILGDVNPTLIELWRNKLKQNTRETVDLKSKFLLSVVHWFSPPLMITQENYLERYDNIYLIGHESVLIKG